MAWLIFIKYTFFQRNHNYRKVFTNDCTVIRHIFRAISKEYLNDELEDDMHKEAREELRVRLKLAEIEYADHFGVTVDLHR